MKKCLFTLAVVLAANLTNAQGLGWREMTSGPAGDVFANGNQTNGTVIVSGQTGQSEGGCWLFDGGLGYPKWCVVTPAAWVVYRFDNGDRWAVTNYALTINAELPRSPGVWQLEGSNDLAGDTPAAVLAATWHVVDAQSFNSALGYGTFPFDCSGNETAFN
ncbi:MAG: hypothetical protein FWF96_04505, partial [Kiritimatiellaeota bacterium]|nr:hypothetical protein [Kiritimatiellota bacterium]